MDARDHLRTTGAALKNWFVAQTYDAAAVALLWLAGLLLVGVPWAPLWAILGGLFQYVPHVGAVLALIGPAIAGGLSGGWERFFLVLAVYAAIAVIDGFVLQPYFMKRTARVPIWASILAPLVLGVIIPFWGVFLAAPALAVVYAYRNRARTSSSPGPPR